jgi:hypothetical protein
MDENRVKIEYVHHDLNEEITAIGGHYVTTKEIRLPVKEKVVFYTVGYGVMDTTCCGTGGCGYATVYGYIVDWKKKKNTDGLEVTILESLGDENLRTRLKNDILKSETVQQVNFL